VRVLIYLILKELLDKITVNKWGGIMQFSKIFTEIFFSVPIIVFLLILCGVCLPTTKKMIRKFVLKKETLSWRAFVFSMMFFLSSYMAVFIFGVFISANIDSLIFEGLSLFLLIYIPIISLGAGLVFWGSNWLVKNKYWGILGVVLGCASAGLLFLEYFLSH
jgi:hypothetical protein